MVTKNWLKIAWLMHELHWAKNNHISLTWKNRNVTSVVCISENVKVKIVNTIQQRKSLAVFLMKVCNVPYTFSCKLDKIVSIDNFWKIERPFSRYYFFFQKPKRYTLGYNSCGFPKAFFNFFASKSHVFDG